MAKAVILFSGGLDSILAARFMLDEGIELEAVNFLTVFCNSGPSGDGKTPPALKSAADRLNIVLRVFEVNDEYFDIIRKPKYGYGRGINPCLACRIFMIKKAALYMKDIGASFLVTGDVLGQRPMSQRQDAFRIIDRDTGLKGLILRPLSAKLLDLTIPEKTGLIDRQRLLGIKGRSRKIQMELAKEKGIKDYPSPAGGCLLADPVFAKRMRRLMERKPGFTLDDILFLKSGRHFSLAADAELAVGRDKRDNERLSRLAGVEDMYFRPAEVKGPIAVGRGAFSSEDIFRACRIIARYSDADANEGVKVEYKMPSKKLTGSVTVLPSGEQELNRMRV